MIKKLISSLLIAVAVMAVIPKGASAEWEHYNGRYKYKEENSYVTGWKYLDNDWYCFDSNGVIRSGWIYDNGNWYFCYIHGQMAHDTTINGYYLNSNGAWTTSEITADEARKLILNVDSTYISQNNYELSTDYKEYSKENMPYLEDWNFPKEPMFGFYYSAIGSDGSGGGEYFVGKDSKNVYALFNQGNTNAYQIEGNSIKKTFQWKGVGGSSKYGDWR